MVCTHTVHPQKNNDWGLSKLQLLIENTSPAPLHPSWSPRSREEHRILSLPPPTFGSHQSGTRGTSSLSTLLSKARARSPVSHHCVCEADTRVPMS